MYTVFIDDNFHFMDDSERLRHGEYQTYDEAVDACKKIVNDSLNHLYSPGMSRTELYNQYVSFGDDPYVSPNGQASHFSARDFAQMQCEVICSN